MASAFRRKIHVALQCQLQHPMRDVEADGALHVRGDRRDDVARATGQLEHAIGRLEARELNQAPLPAPILSVGEKPCNEVVAVSDGGKQPPDVLLLTLRCGDAASESQSADSIHCFGDEGLLDQGRTKDPGRTKH